MFEILLIAALVAAVSYGLQALGSNPGKERERAPSADDLGRPSVREGAPVPILFGRALSKAPFLVWDGDYTATPNNQKAPSGLFFGSKSVQIGWFYELAMQLVWCRGEDVRWRRFYWQEKEVFDGNVAGEQSIDIDQQFLFGSFDDGPNGIAMTVDFYPGNRFQSVSPFLNTPERQQITTAITPTAPRKAKTCHMVVRELTPGLGPQPTQKGAYIGNANRIDAMWAELERFTGLVPGQPSGDRIVTLGGDVNPINILYEALTDDEWGLKEPDSKVDTGAGSSFVRASATLKAEGIGMSWFWTAVRNVDELIEEIARVIDGAIFEDRVTGKWTVNLARDPDDPDWGYDFATLPQLDDSNIAEVVDWSPGSWTDTVNQVSVMFDSREALYKRTPAPAQDAGNAALRAGGNLLAPLSRPMTIEYPSIKDPTVANAIAWRELRLRSRPLVKAKIKSNRELWEVKPGRLVKWLDLEVDPNPIVMRVVGIDEGNLEDAGFTFDLVQDVWTAFPGAFANSPPTKWNRPNVQLDAIPAAEQVAIEAPRALVARDTGSILADDSAKVFCSGRRQGGESSIELRQRSPGGSGAYSVAGLIRGFCRIGELDSELLPGTDIPTTVIQVNGTPDSVASLQSVFRDNLTTQDLGVDLAHLVLIGDEFMLVRSASTLGSDLTLENVYRGVCGTGQARHAANAPVYLVFNGAALTDTQWDATATVDIELRPRNSRETFEGAVTPVALTLARRAVRPNPPAGTLYNGLTMVFTMPNMEADGTGLNGVGFDVDVRRRDFEIVDEVSALLADLDPLLPTEYRIRVFVAPTGANTLVSDSGWLTSGTPFPTVTQVDIVSAGAAGTEIRVEAAARHAIDVGGSVLVLESWSPMLHDVVPSSSRTSQFYIGNVGVNVGTTGYNIPANGNYTVVLGAAFAIADVDFQINGGAWNPVPGLGAGGTTGTLNGLVAGQVLSLRYDFIDPNVPNWVEVRNPSSQPVAYGVFRA